MADSCKGKRLNVLERLGLFSCGRSLVVRKAGTALHSMRGDIHANDTANLHGFSLWQGSEGFSSRLYHLMAVLSTDPGKKNSKF